MSLLNLLQCVALIYLAVTILVCLLPLSSHHQVRYYGCFTAFVYLCGLVGLFLTPIFTLRPRDVRNCGTASAFLKHISKVISIQWDLRGTDILEVERGAVIVANHQSSLDALGAFSIWKNLGKCSIVARKEVFYLWPFGLAAWLGGVVYIDHRRARVANKQLDDASRLIKENTKLWIFPEGIRNPNPDTMLPFKKGAFRIAVDCQVPIIPVIYSPYYFIDHEKKYFGQGRVIMQCLEPVSTKGKTKEDIDSIIEEVRGKMMKQYDLLKEEVLLAHKNASTN